MKSKRAQVFLIPLIIFLLSCGGGGEGTNQAGTAEFTGQTGRIIDSPVDGIRYETATKVGVSSNGGKYEYETGESVSFYLGDILLGTTLASEALTPVDLYPSDLMQQGRLAQLLQTADSDSDASNGITIQPSTHDRINSVLETSGTAIPFHVINKSLNYNSIPSLALDKAEWIDIDVAQNHLSDSIAKLEQNENYTRPSISDNEDIKHIMQYETGDPDHPIILAMPTGEVILVHADRYTETVEGYTIVTPDDGRPTTIEIDKNTGAATSLTFDNHSIFLADPNDGKLRAIYVHSDEAPIEIQGPEINGELRSEPIKVIDINEENNFLDDAQDMLMLVIENILNDPTKTEGWTEKKKELQKQAVRKLVIELINKTPWIKDNGGEDIGNILFQSMDCVYTKDTKERVQNCIDLTLTSLKQYYRANEELKEILLSKHICVDTDIQYLPYICLDKAPRTYDIDLNVVAGGTVIGSIFSYAPKTQFLISEANDGSKGTLTFNNSTGSFSYTAKEGVTGKDRFVVQVYNNDGVDFSHVNIEFSDRVNGYWKGSLTFTEKTYISGSETIGITGCETLLTGGLNSTFRMVTKKLSMSTSDPGEAEVRIDFNPDGAASGYIQLCTGNTVTIESDGSFNYLARVAQDNRPDFQIPENNANFRFDVTSMTNTQVNGVFSASFNWYGGPHYPDNSGSGQCKGTWVAYKHVTGNFPKCDYDNIALKCSDSPLVDFCQWEGF